MNLDIYLSKLLFVLSIVSVLTPMEANAVINGSHVLSYGARSLARGGTDIAVTDDSTGINSNPAGMSWLDGTVVDVNLLALFPTLTLENDNNPSGAESQDRFLLAPGAGFAHHTVGNKWAFGISFAAPNALATDYTVKANYFNSDPTVAGNSSTQNASSEWLHMRLSPAFSYAPNDKFSIGARLGVEYMTLDLRAPLGRSYLDLATADGFGYSLGVGIQYRPTPKLTLGVSVDSQSYMRDLKSRGGDASVALDVSGLNLGAGPFANGTVLSFSDMTTEISDWEAPPIVGAGFSYQLTDKFTLMGDVKYFFWSETNDHMTIKFSGAGAEKLLAATGADTLTIPMKWEDSVGVAIGGSYKFTDFLTCHLGYNYGEAVTKDNFANYLTPIEVEHHLTGGATFTSGQFEISLAAIYSFGNSQSNNSMSGVDEAVLAQLGLPVDSELNGAEVTAEAFSLAMQFTYRF